MVASSTRRRTGCYRIRPRCSLSLGYPGGVGSDFAGPVTLTGTLGQDVSKIFSRVLPAKSLMPKAYS